MPGIARPNLPFLSEIRLRPLVGGLLSFAPGVYGLWDRLRPMGDPRPPEYGRNVWRARLDDARKAGQDISPQTVMELGPGRSLSAPIAALLDGARLAIGMDAVAYASGPENLRVFDALVKEAGVDERRAAELRRAVATAGDRDRETVLQYRAPWSDESTVPPGTVEFIFSISVLEHVTDPDAVYRSCFRWLRPGGVMAHKIDHSSHGITRHWNGHYWIPDRLWRLILGRRPYAINRWTPDDHRAAAKAAGFEVVSVECGMANDDGSALYRQDPQGRFRNVCRQSLFAKTSIFVMRKPDVQVCE